MRASEKRAFIRAHRALGFTHQEAVQLMAAHKARNNGSHYTDYLVDRYGWTYQVEEWFDFWDSRISRIHFKAPSGAVWTWEIG